MPVQMQLTRIIISELGEQQMIYLRETEGSRTFPIVIGPFEAMSISKGVKRIEPVRPLTHNLLINSIEALGGELDSILINDLREHTYFAKLRVRANGELIEVDARPSDAIAVAVTCDPALPIWVSEEVLEEASNTET